MAALIPESGQVILITPTVRRQSGLRHWLGQVVAWTVILGVGAVLTVATIIPRIAGATPYVIETGSMRPSLPPGTLIVDKPADPSAINVGDVITYQLRSGDPTVVTHRVVTMGFDGLGNPRYRTQGDTNNAPDAKWVLPEQVRGEKWYAVPYLGYVAFWVNGSARGVIIGIVALGLIAYALRMFQQHLAEKKNEAEETA